MKKKIKKALRFLVPSETPPIIVASMGRSGSSLVWRSICHAVAETRLPTMLSSIALRLVSEQAWDLDTTKFALGIVYKTHGLAHELPENSGAKVLFLFGSASDAAMSVAACSKRYGQKWIDEHFSHLRASGDFSELAFRDVLRFGEQLDGWIGKTGTKRMLLHYDAIWDYQEEISHFIGKKVFLPDRRPRSWGEYVTAHEREVFTKTYFDLDRRIATLPACQVLE